jgi:hypothetical protein
LPVDTTTGAGGRSRQHIHAGFHQVDQPDLVVAIVSHPELRLGDRQEQAPAGRPREVRMEAEVCRFSIAIEPLAESYTAPIPISVLAHARLTSVCFTRVSTHATQLRVHCSTFAFHIFRMQDSRIERLKFQKKFRITSKFKITGSRGFSAAVAETKKSRRSFPREEISEAWYWLPFVFVWCTSGFRMLSFDIRDLVSMITWGC